MKKGMTIEAKSAQPTSSKTMIFSTASSGTAAINNQVNYCSLNNLRISNQSTDPTDPTNLLVSYATRMPVSGILKSMTIIGDLPTNPDSLIITLIKEGAPTALSITLDSTDDDGNGNATGTDLVHQIPITAQELAAFMIDNSNNSNIWTGTISLVFEPS